MLLIRNVITLLDFFFFRAPQTKFLSGTLPVGIESTQVGSYTTPFFYARRLLCVFQTHNFFLALNPVFGQILIQGSVPRSKEDL